MFYLHYISVKNKKDELNFAKIINDDVSEICDCFKLIFVKLNVEVRIVRHFQINLNVYDCVNFLR